MCGPGTSVSNDDCENLRNIVLQSLCEESRFSLFVGIQLKKELSCHLKCHKLFALLRFLFLNMKYWDYLNVFQI